MEFCVSAQYWVNLVLLWIGFGTFTGLVAKVFLPAGEPKNFFGVLLTGMLGSFIGPLAVSMLQKSDSFQPVSPLGFLASILVTAALFLLLRLLLFLFRRDAEKPLQTERKMTNPPAANR